LVSAIIVADGDVPSDEAQLRDVIAPDEDGPPLVIAADGGARKAAALGLAARLVIGDGDSLGPAEVADLRARGTEVMLFPAEKDESDTELAMREAIAAGARRIVILGAFGGARLDHSLANVALLALPEVEGRDVSLTDGAATVRLIGHADGPGELRLAGAPGDLVSLFPLDPTVEGIVTAGLRYPLHDEPLRLGPSRGLSNRLVETEAHVTTRRGRLLVVHTHTPPLEKEIR
jgi:thiamine pyrophosphokinase